MINDIAGPCWARCAPCEKLPGDKPALALLDGTQAFWDQRGNYPRYVAGRLVGQRFQTALARLRAASTDRRPVAVAAYTSRPQTGEVAGAVRLMLCGSDDTECNRLCSARRSKLAPCDGAVGFDDRELCELLLEPRHRSPLYRPSHLAARFALGLSRSSHQAGPPVVRFQPRRSVSPAAVMPEAAALELQEDRQ